jgi:ATP-dependent RNA helicase DDX47/RRP3
MSGHVKQLSDADHAAAVKAFEALGICTQLAEAAAALGWKSPSAIQEQAIPSVLQGGSGRTHINFPWFAGTMA